MTRKSFVNARLFSGDARRSKQYVVNQSKQNAVQTSSRPTTTTTVRPTTTAYRTTTTHRTTTTQASTTTTHRPSFDQTFAVSTYRPSPQPKHHFNDNVVASTYRPAHNFFNNPPKSSNGEFTQTIYTTQAIKPLVRSLIRR